MLLIDWHLFCALFVPDIVGKLPNKILSRENAEKGIMFELYCPEEYFQIYLPLNRTLSRRSVFFYCKLIK